MTLPENGVDWSCDGPVVNGTVNKRTKCELICRDGYTAIKGKDIRYIIYPIIMQKIAGRRRRHRCALNEHKNPEWKEPENVLLLCEPTSK